MLVIQEQPQYLMSVLLLEMCSAVPRVPSAAFGVVDVAQKQHVVCLPQEGMPAASLAAPSL